MADSCECQAKLALVVCLQDSGMLTFEPAEVQLRKFREKLQAMSDQGFSNFRLTSASCSPSATEIPRQTRNKQ